MNKLLLLPILPCLLYACSNSVKTASTSENQKNTADSTQAFQPELINNLKVPMLTNIVSADKKSVVTLETGTTITIPASTFVDASGKVVTGDVAIHWQEFQTLPEIMLSGLPMTYDSCGVQHNFQSGGMFTITATQKDEQLKIASGKSIKIDLVSINDQKKFNFYTLQTDGSWDYKTTAAGKNLKKEEATKQPEKTPPVNTNSLLDISADVSALEELKNVQIIGWKATRDLSLIEKNSLNHASFNVDIKRTESQGIYKITCRSKDATYSFDVTPYTFEMAAAETKCSEKDQQAENKETVDFLTRLEEGKIVRSIEINNLGTHNWDCIKNMDQFVQRTTNLHLENISFNQQTMCKFFFVSPEENLMVSLKLGRNNIFIPKNSKACILAILPNNEIAICNSHQLRGASAANANKIIDLVLKKTRRTVVSPEQVGELIQELI